MVLKTALIFTPVFIFAFLIDYNLFTVSQEVEDSYSNENQLNIQLEDVSANGTSCNGDFSETSTKEIKIGNSSSVQVSCILNETNAPVEIVNASKLASILQIEPNVTNRQVPGSCLAVIFYSPSCPFSCMAAPHFNALPRFFPHVKMVAVDAMKYRGFNAQLGIVGTPTLMLFHSGRPAAKLNETSEYDLENFANFITKHTGLAPIGKLVVTSADFNGPISATPVKETDYYLLLSWVVIAARVLYSLYFSTWGRSLVDATLNAWREAEAQHRHSD